MHVCAGRLAGGQKAKRHACAHLIVIVTAPDLTNVIGSELARLRLAQSANRRHGISRRQGGLIGRL